MQVIRECLGEQHQGGHQGLKGAALAVGRNTAASQLPKNPQGTPGLGTRWRRELWSCSTRYILLLSHQPSQESIEGHGIRFGQPSAVTQDWILQREAAITDRGYADCPGTGTGRVAQSCSRTSAKDPTAQPYPRFWPICKLVLPGSQTCWNS